MKALLVGEYGTEFDSTVQTWLQANGYRTAHCRRADALNDYGHADVLILDADQSPGCTLRWLYDLRQVSTVPVLALASPDTAVTAARLLRCGVDEYAMKPVRVGELFARIESAAVRARRREKAPRRVDIRDFSIDLRARTIQVGSEPVALSPKEFAVLATLARNVGTAVPREHIMTSVWGETSQARARSLEVLLATIRAKIKRPELINTVRGFGYRLA